MSLNAHLAELSVKHKLLERQIEEEMARPISDDARVRRLKREKLRLKDTIVKLSGPTRHLSEHQTSIAKVVRLPRQSSHTWQAAVG